MVASMAIIAILAMIATTTSPRCDVFPVMDSFQAARPSFMK
jgi:adenine-specific DNA glycosylase